MQISLKTKTANCRNLTDTFLDTLRMVTTGDAPNTSILPCFVPSSSGQKDEQVEVRRNIFVDRPIAMSPFVGSTANAETSLRYSTSLMVETFQSLLSRKS